MPGCQTKPNNPRSLRSVQRSMLLLYCLFACMLACLFDGGVHMLSTCFGLRETHIPSVLLRHFRMLYDADRGVSARG